MGNFNVQRRRTAGMLLAVPLFALGIAPRARAAGATTIEAAIAAAAAVFMADARAVGLSVGVIQGGSSQRYHYGTVSQRRPRRPDDRTIYPIASLTKTFTGALLARAQLDGKLHLDQDIRQYLDGDYPNLAFDGQPIRLFHLLNHRSGLPAMLPDLPELAPDFPSAVPYAQRSNAAMEKLSRADFYTALHGVVLTAAPGSTFRYSNGAAQLAGYILERVYGQSFEALVQACIAGPLGMSDTVIAPTVAQKARLADGYENGSVQPYLSEKIQAAAALKSTLADMLAYARWQLAEKDPVVVLSHQPSYQNGDFAVGLNWQMFGKGARRVIFQDGSTPGFACLLALHPYSGTAVVLLSNEIDGDTARRLSTLADSIAAALDKAYVALPRD